LLAITIAVVSAGRLGDLFGRRRVLLSGIAVFTVGSACCAMAPQLWLLIAARFVQGLGAAVMMAISMAMVAGSVPKARIGSAIGLLGTMSAVGTALGPTVGGGLIAWLGWQSLFMAQFPLGMFGWLLAWRAFPADMGAGVAKARFDRAGTLLLALSLAAYALAMTLGRGHPGLLNLALLVLAVIGGGLFVVVQSRAAAPLVPLALLRNPWLSAGFCMSALVTAVVMATLVVGPFYLSGALGLDPARVGLVMSCGPVVSALAGWPAGRMVELYGARTVRIAGLSAAVCGCALLAVMSVGAGVAGYVAALVTVTAGYAVFQAANNTAVMAGSEAQQRGLVSGLLNLSRNLGLITGASLMGALYAWGEAGQGAAASAAGLHHTFSVALVMAGIALAIALRGRHYGRATQGR
jgi:MFS family permease